MAKHIADIEIGRRMSEEVERIWLAKGKTIKQLGVGRNSLHEWRNGMTPSGYMLQKLYYIGGDVIYVLTGKRSSKDGSKPV